MHIKYLFPYGFIHIIPRRTSSGASWLILLIHLDLLLLGPGQCQGYNCRDWTTGRGLTQCFSGWVISGLSACSIEWGTRGVHATWITFHLTWPLKMDKAVAKDEISLNRKLNQRFLVHRPVHHPLLCLDKTSARLE